MQDILPSIIKDRDALIAERRVLAFEEIRTASFWINARKDEEEDEVCISPWKCIAMPVSAID